MKVLVVPDVHGSREWEVLKTFPQDSYDRIVFMGDYFDAWENKWPEQGENIEKDNNRVILGLNKNGNLIVTSYDFSKKESLKKRSSSSITLFDRNAFMKDGTLVPSEDWINYNIKNYNLSSSEIQFHIAENEQKIDDMTNYVLKKLQKAGIEVVTDKEEFARILEGQALFLKKYAPLSAKTRSAERLFWETTTGATLARRFTARAVPAIKTQGRA